MRLETNIFISLIIPTRNRLRLLKGCLHSFFTKARNPQLIEVILLCDFDDWGMRKFEDFVLMNNWNIKMVFQRQSNKIIRDYNNFGAQCSTGKYVWILNDDFEMLTNDWDHILFVSCEEFLLNKPDRILYVQIDDNTHTNWKKEHELGCCVPILTRETIDAQNGIMPAEIDMWGADITLFRIFRSLKENRILNLIDKIKLLHYCRHNNTMYPDATARRVEEISKNYEVTQEIFNEYVSLLNQKIMKDIS